MFEGWKDRIERLNLRNDDRPAFPRTTCDIPMPKHKQPKEETKMGTETSKSCIDKHDVFPITVKELKDMLAEDVITLKEYRQELRIRIGLDTDIEVDT